MSTKNDPGKFDCLAKVDEDEPYFLLRAKDPHAPALVELWAAIREAEFGNYEKLDEARLCATQMREWFIRTKQKLISERIFNALPPNPST